jgi:hypothetical protein
MTFFSRAARIWSQGLRTVAGEVANAIDKFLAGAAYGLAIWFIRTISATALLGREGLGLSVRLILTDYMVAAGLPLKKSTEGPWIKSAPWGAQKNFLERTR